MNCKILNIGLTHYMDCCNLQKQLLAKIKNKKAEDHIIITEHYPVITIGRSGSKRNLLVSEEFLKSRNIEVAEVDRGGDITYHGLGQIVMYPIIDLKKMVPGTNFFKIRAWHHFLDLHEYLRYLEDVIITLLKEYNIDSFKIEGRTGVWAKKGKIASIGIGVSRWVTFHGVALNVNCDLTPFNWINPCGFKDINVTSMQEILVDKIDIRHIKNRVIDIFVKNLIRGGVRPLERDNHSQGLIPKIC